MSEKKYRLLRVLEYVGPRDWIDQQIKLRGVKGSKVVGLTSNCIIREAIVGDVAELLPAVEPDPQPSKPQKD